MLDNTDRYDLLNINLNYDKKIVGLDFEDLKLLEINLI
jgi:hypothetical protein